MTKEPIEEARPDKLTADEAIELVLKRPGMFGLTRTDEYRKVEAERDAALAAVERVRAVLAEERAWLEHLVESGDAVPRNVIGIGRVEAALDGAPEPEEKP